MYGHFVQKFNGVPVGIVREEDLISLADQVASLEVRLTDNTTRLNNDLEYFGDEFSVNDQVVKNYSFSRRKYHDIYWKYQAYLVLSGQAHKCRLILDFSETLESKH